jgi:15-cis-phytoene synthase
MMSGDETRREPRNRPGEELMSRPGDPAEAYRHCEAVTRARAGNFYYGIRLLPAHKRRAMCAVYAFARRVDDIGDGELAPERKLMRLSEQAHVLEVLAAGDVAAPAGAAPDPVMVALADASPRFALPVGALGELIEGVRMDVEGHSYERFEDLVLYCRRVAGAIGRLCLAIFEARPGPSAQDAHMQELADDLGVALQITNILRDLREDAENGRVYLPAEDLRRFGVSSDGERAPALLAAMGPSSGGASNGSTSGAGEADKLAALVRFEAERAREWFERGIALAGMLDRRSAACVLAMAGIYERLLERIAAHPERALAQRVALAPWEKAWVAASSMLAFDGRGRRARPTAGAPIGGQG